MEVPTISREELKRLIEGKGEYFLVDVREKWEVEKYGAIPTAHNLPMSEIKEALTLNPKQFFNRYGFLLDKDETIITYCRSGARSERATAFLIANGYKSVNFKGSVLSWSEIDPNVKPH